MGVVDLLYHERELRRLKGDAPDVLKYDALPQPLRVQIIRNWRAAFGQWTDDYEPGDPAFFNTPNPNWMAVEHVMCDTLGLFKLGDGQNAQSNVEEFFLKADVPMALSLVEVAFRIMSESHSVRRPRQESIDEVNERFRRHAVGYEFVDTQVIRVDAAFVHAEITKPALVLLAQPGFQGAEAEFRQAHLHYLEGRYKEAMNEALKAFESAMKCVAAARKIPVDRKATAKTLIDLMISNSVLPDSMGSHLAGLRSALESGLPAQRNQKSGHGQGAQVLEIPRHVAAHALHLAAANIVLVLESHLATT
jgi:AbiJ N-terminal domain 4